MTIHPAAMIAVGFLSGSIPFGLLIGRLKGIDIRKHGSGNIGASNVGRVLGTRYFFLCFALDVLKGTLPTLAMGYLLGRLGSFSMPPRDAWWWLGGMVAPVMGHVFSPWLKFKGGKGVATALGVMFGVFPVLTVVGAAGLTTWVIVLAIWRYISLASMVAGTLLPVFAVTEFLLAELAGLIDPRVGTFDAAWPFVSFTCVLAVLVVLTHLSNIKRLRNGTELRVGRGAKPQVTPQQQPQSPA